ncbi:unnamed protein product [Heterobilharzia americana]|nr:unnamed protein product [Heterobilharzia americana]
MIMSNNLCSKRNQVNNTVSLCALYQINKSNMELHSTTVPKFFTYINETYGLPVRRLINKLTRLSQTEARFTNHRIFNIRCMKNQIIPKYLRIRIPIYTDKIQRAIEHVSKLCLKEEIHRIIKKLSTIRNKIEQLKCKIMKIVNCRDYGFIIETSDKARLATLKKSRRNQIKKFNKLMQEKYASENNEITKETSSNIDRTKWVVNLSSKALSSAEMKVLEKGLNFNITVDHLKPEDVIPSIEVALSSVDVTTAEQVRAQCALALKKQKKTQRNLTKLENSALNNLRKDNSIVIAKSDKGNSTVVMDKSDYLKKMDEHIQTGPYEEIKKPIDTVMNKIKKSTTDLIRRLKPSLGKSEWFTLMPKTNNPSRIYGTIKVHKAGYPIRPIVDFRNTPTYEISKYLASVLRPVRDRSNSRLVNSYELKQKLNDLHIEEDEKMVSFDVTSLYTKIPINMALEAVRNQLDTDSQLTQRTKASVGEIMLGVQLCLTSTVFKFQGKIYRQTEGVAMGSPISPIVADIFMDSWEDMALRTYNPTPKIWWRYVDDTFTVLKSEHIDSFLTHINSVVNAIQFTYEVENEQGELPMLDCRIKRRIDGGLDTTVYRKPTHSNRYLDFKSSHPVSVKAGLVKCLNNRAEKLTSHCKDLNKELKHIKEALITNNYPHHFIKKFTRTHKKQNNNTNTNTNNSDNISRKEISTSIVIPYKEGTSETIRRILNKVGIRVAFKPTNSLRGKLCRLKDPIEPIKQNNIIYQIPCNDCEVKYIGQTSRSGSVRLTEHRNLAKHRTTDPNKINNLEKHSAIALHSLTHNHTIGWDKTTVLKSNIARWRERLITESLFIESTPNTCNRNDATPIPEIWKTLLPIKKQKTKRDQVTGL